MQELVGRLTALDPEASETLKVVAYFDALVASGVGLDGLLRAAAVLSGVAAGAERRGRVTRVDSTGRRLDAIGDVERHPERVGTGTAVWLERTGSLHANDEMVVERLALAVELLETHRGPVSSLDVVVDAGRSADERREALTRLGIDVAARIRLVATGVGDAAPGTPTTVVPTRNGMLRATVDSSGRVSPADRTGLGVWVRADHAPDSWQSAVIAYRLTDATDRIVDATDLGAMLILAHSYDPEAPHDDVTTLAGLDALQSTVLRALVEADSIRSAAARLGMHHSSVQARHDALTRDLGYDPRTPIGRMRYVAAALLLRLSDDSTAPDRPPRRHGR